MNYIKCSGCHMRHTEDKFLIVNNERRKCCVDCLNRQTKNRKKNEPTDEPIPEPIPEIKINPTILYTKCVACPNFKSFLSDIVISNIDIFNLQKDYTITEKIIELIQEEYDNQGLYEKPFYTLNKKKQILYIKGKEWLKHCIDDENILFNLVSILLEKIKKKCEAKEIVVDLDICRDELYEKLLEMGCVVFKEV